MHEYIFRNIPGNPEWIGSFYERLVEYGVWDKDEFWKLHLALIAVAKSSAREKTIDCYLAWSLAKIQSRVLGLMAAHHNKKDVFNIRNLKPDELVEFSERFDHAILSAFSGEVIPESSYDLINPLTTHA